MNQFRKDEMILKIRKSSLIVGILCIVSVLVNTVLAIFNGFSSPNSLDPHSKIIMLSNTAGYSIRALIMLLAAVLFFSMFRSGRPFTPKKIRMVLLIAVMLFLRSVLSSVFYSALLEIGLVKSAARFVIQGGWMESILFLFAALIMYYASMLQQESDETL